MLSPGAPPNASIGSREDSQDKRTWFRLLFESQQAAYEPNAPGQASIGWYYWTCACELLPATDVRDHRVGD
jgi:glucan 1,3-beta-glucosidase